VTRPVYNRATRFELHGKDSAGVDRLVSCHPTLYGAALARRQPLLKDYYVLDNLTGNKKRAKKSGGLSGE
jgi:hypothetical protein